MLAGVAIFVSKLIDHCVPSHLAAAVPEFSAALACTKVQKLPEE